MISIWNAPGWYPARRGDIMKRVCGALGFLLIACTHTPPPAPRPSEGPMCVTVQQDMFAGVRTVCADDSNLIDRFLARHGGDR